MSTHHNLDFLRTLAVVLVFVDHATLFAGVNSFHGWNLRWIGVYGVYLFFVHTCLVLMWSLERRPQVLDFYLRRVFRIYPLAIATVLLVALFRLPLYPPGTFSRGLVASNLLLIQNVWTHANIMGTLWSLPLEVQMYLLLPPLFLFARREKTLWPFLLAWGLACGLAKANETATNLNNFYAVIPHFLPGVMAFIGFKRFAPRLPALTFPVFVALLLVYFEHRPSVHQGWKICLLLGLLLPFFKDFGQGTFTTACHKVATYSYGIYLLHLPSLYISYVVLHLGGAWKQAAVSVLLTGLSSWLAYHALEHPMVQLGSRFAARFQRRFGAGPEAAYGLDLV